jgi:hypothetical protein
MILIGVRDKRAELGMKHILKITVKERWIQQIKLATWYGFIGNETNIIASTVQIDIIKP